jgi:hypothetical protein
MRGRDEARADLVRRQDTARADDALRHELVTAMTEAAGSLYLTTQHYWRAKEDASMNPGNKDLADTRDKLRASLDAQYLKSRTAGQVLENRLEGYFISSEQKRRWHQVMDLLTVRYFQLIGRDTDGLYGANKGDEHSGLEVSELRAPKTLLNTYRAALSDAVRLVFDGELRARS